MANTLINANAPPEDVALVESVGHKTPPYHMLLQSMKNFVVKSNVDRQYNTETNLDNTYVRLIAGLKDGNSPDVLS